MTEYNDDLPTSKAQQKRDQATLQQLGLSLMDMKPAQRERLPLSPTLLQALEDARRITSNEARRRHAQYIGRVMRESDSDLIIQALASLNDPLRQQRLTNWVEAVLDCEQIRDTDATIQQILDFYPHGERQTLRNRIRNLHKAKPAESEAARTRLQTERRKLMNYLNELDQSAPLY